jgi:purine-nucleoside phosphorylase
MQNYKASVKETAAFLKKRLDRLPSIGIMTGTGLGESVDKLKVSSVFHYRDLPHFPVSTVDGHHGRLLLGTLACRPVAVLQGRFHLYEGYSPLEVTFPVRVLQALGVRTLIVTNAAGGLNPAFKAGSLMLITDHINLSGANPLVGPNHDDWGVRFPDMNKTYDGHLSDLARQGATVSGIGLAQGVYAGLLGPSLETPAEIRFLKTIGADAVGLSTIQEVIAAVHGGMRVLGLSTLTNINDPDHPCPALLADIIDIARKAAPALETIIKYVVENMNDHPRS